MNYGMLEHTHNPRELLAAKAKEKGWNRNDKTAEDGWVGGGGEQQRNVGKVNRSKPSPSSLCKAWTYILVVNLRPKDGIKVEMKEGQIDKGNGEVGVGGAVLEGII